MPQVKVMLFSTEDDNFSLTKVFEYDDDKWADMGREDRQAMIDADANRFKDDMIDWDYRVL